MTSLAPAAASVAFGRITALLLQGCALLLLSQTLGSRAFGVFSLVLVVQGLMAVVSNLGIFASGQYRAGRRDMDIGHVAAASLAATAVGSVLLVPPSAFILSWLYPAVLSELPFELFVIGVLAGPIRLGYEALLGVFTGTGDVRGQSAIALAGPAVLLAILVGAAAASGLTLSVAVLAWLVSQLAVLALAVIALRAHGPLGSPREALMDRSLWSGLLAVGAGAYATYVAYWVSMRLDRVALNVVGGPETVGVYALAAWVAESFALLPTAVGAVLFPRIARDPATAGPFVAAASRAVLGVSIAIGVVVLLGAAIIAAALGGPIASAVPVLAVILPGNILFGLFGIFTSYWMAVGRTARPAAYYAAAAAARIVVIFVVFEPFGIAGVGAALSAVSAVAVVAAAVQVARAMRVPVSALLIPGVDDARRAVRASASLLGSMRTAMGG